MDKGTTTVSENITWLRRLERFCFGRAPRSETLLPRSAVSHLEENVLDYEPDPIDTSKVQLSDEILELTERLAENAHDVWAQQRREEGWRLGPRRDQDKKEHPSLVPYKELPEEEKDYDRNTAMETLKAMIALGYRIEKAPHEDSQTD
jgi:RyR domain